MKIFIGYATSEGQTRKIARHMADRIADSGHSVELLELADEDDLDLTRFDQIILASPIHVGHYSRPFIEFAAKHADQLNKIPTLLISVSLAAAGHDAEDWRALDHIVEDLRKATSWTPTEVEHIAGAYYPSKYDVFRRFVMRRIVGAKDPSANLDQDKEYTDWKALDALIDVRIK